MLVLSLFQLIQTSWSSLGYLRGARLYIHRVTSVMWQCREIQTQKAYFWSMAFHGESPDMPKTLPRPGEASKCQEKTVPETRSRSSNMQPREPQNETPNPAVQTTKPRKQTGSSAQYSYYCQMQIQNWEPGIQNRSNPGECPFTAPADLYSLSSRWQVWAQSIKTPTASHTFHVTFSLQYNYEGL